MPLEGIKNKSNISLPSLNVKSTRFFSTPHPSSIKSLQSPSKQKNGVKSFFNSVRSVFISFLEFFGIISKSKEMPPDFKKHLPENLYAKCLEYKLIETAKEQLEDKSFQKFINIYHHTKWESAEVSKELIILYPKDRQCPEHVIIEIKYDPPRIEQNYSRMRLEFSEKKLIHHQTIPPMVAEEECLHDHFMSLLLNDILPSFKR